MKYDRPEIASQGDALNLVQCNNKTNDCPDGNGTDESGGAYELDE